jgi:hypothetical protein
VNAAPFRRLVNEARTTVQAIQSELSAASAGRVVVSGMLAEQLARELADGARPGAVVVGDEPALAGASVVVRVIAGDPSEADDSLVRAADRAEVPVVLVQLWPQAEWRTPFVLSPFVVECRAGEGFPVPEIAARVAEAVEDAPALAARIPVLAETVESTLVRSAILRSALLALSSGPASRPLLALEQVRMLSRLRVLEAPQDSPPLQVVAGAAAASLGVSYALRTVARSARGVLPAPLANVVVAAGGTWAIHKLARILEARLAND